MSFLPLLFLRFRKCFFVLFIVMRESETIPGHTMYFVPGDFEPGTGSRFSRCVTSDRQANSMDPDPSPLEGSSKCKVTGYVFRRMQSGYVVFVSPSFFFLGGGMLGPPPKRISVFLLACLQDHQKKGNSKKNRPM